MKVQIEISKEEHKREVAGILVENGYTVRKVKVVINGRSKWVLEIEKE